MREGVLQTGVRGGHDGGEEALHDDQDDVLCVDDDVIYEYEVNYEVCHKISSTLLAPDCIAVIDVTAPRCKRVPSAQGRGCSSLTTSWPPEAPWLLPPTSSEGLRS